MGTEPMQTVYREAGAGVQGPPSNSGMQAVYRTARANVGLPPAPASTGETSHQLGSESSIASGGGGRAQRTISAVVPHVPPSGRTPPKQPLEDPSVPFRMHRFQMPDLPSDHSSDED